VRSFAVTGHGRSGSHCRLCRQREGGRGWRSGLASRFAIPAGGPDFECPRGRPWGWRPPDRGLGDTVEWVLAATGIGPLAKRLIRRVTGRPCGCGHRRDRLNRLVPFTPPVAPERGPASAR